jgi:hypothetical protein
VSAARGAFRGYGTVTSALRPLPDFLIIGTKRGGTTSLYYSLLKHPQVMPMFPSARHLPKRNETKGVRFFDTGFHHSESWYRSWFPTRQARLLAQRHVGGRVLVGEASPYYLFHPQAAERAASVVPDVKIIALLRDPVERTHSAWKERVRNGQEGLDFDAALRAEPDRLRGEVDRMMVDRGYYSYAHEFQSYVTQSDYATSLAEWLRHYPKSSLHVTLSEEFYRDPTRSLNGIASFLGIEPRDDWGSERLNAAQGEPPDARTVAQLRERFQPSIRELEAMIGRSTGWLPEAAE